MNKLMLIAALSCCLVACEKEEQKSRKLGKQASAQVKEMEKRINKAAQDNLDKHKEIDEITQ